MNVLVRGLTLFALLLPGFALLLPGARAAGIDVESTKQVLEAKWLTMRPQHVAERKVLFQDVRMAGQNETGTVFFVTALVWDMGKGNPRFRDWGETCVQKFVNQQYTLAPRAGTWEIYGLLVQTGNCKANPAEGVSGIPVASLPGSGAGRGQTASPPPLVRSGGVGQGTYECWASGTPQYGLNLKVYAGNRYVDSEGRQGTFAMGANGVLTFRGGVWDGGLPQGFHAVYYEPKGFPVISIRNPQNNEIAYCEGR